MGQGVGEENPNWKGGVMVIGGYLYQLAPDHPSKTKMGYVCVHRLVMEEKLGRLLERYEVVHHRDGDCMNNDPSNLELCESTGKHFIGKHLTSRGRNGRFTCG